jgi:uncharacterized protein YigA (DUF484 family)
MEPQEIAAYLKSHPEFFEQYAELISQIHIPSPHGNNAISITERQLITLREKVRLLETKLAELISFGEENDAISTKVHRLGVALQRADDLPAAMSVLYSHLGGDFSVPHVAVRLWGAGAGDPDKVGEFAPVADSVKSFADALRQPYCGAAAGQEAVAWLGDAAAHVRSVAQIPLRDGGQDNGCFGLLLLASEEAQRFYSGMGTLFLQRIGDMAAAALRRVAG